jgi:hypothetical protein
MRTHRFGRKIILPSTIAIKHRIRKLMAEDEVRKAETEAAAKSAEISRINGRPRASHLDSPAQSIPK